MQLVAEISSGGKILRKPKKGLIINNIKIRYGEKFKIELVQDLPPVDKEENRLRTNYYEEPNEKFEAALDILLQTVISQCRLSVEVWGLAKVTEVSLKETNEGLNAVIVAHLEIDDETGASAKLAQKNISYELKSEIDNLLAEVEDYVGGKRKETHRQLSLIEEQ